MNEVISATAQLEPLLRPESVAIVGASADTHKISGVIARQLGRLGFEGDIYPINPRHESINGLRCYEGLAELPRVPDVVVIFVNAVAAVEVAEQAAALGVKALAVLTGGFAEVGAEGRALQERLVQIARAAGMAMCGPNTAGLANFNSRFVAYGTSGILTLDHVEKGEVAIVSSSGGLGGSIISYLRSRLTGVSHIVGIGNEAVTSAGDFMEAFVEDDEVNCIVVLLEAVRDPESFFAAADHAARVGKPIVLMKQGRSDVGLRSVMSHTAALGGAATAVDASMRAHGVVQVRDLSALADYAMVFTRLPNVTGYRLGVLSLPGGGTSLMADAAREQSFELPGFSDATVERLGEILPSIATASNPLDPIAGFGRTPGKLERALEIFDSEDNFDVLVFFQSSAQPSYADDLADAIIRTKETMGKPLLCVWESGPGIEPAWDRLHRAGIPVFSSARACFAALAAHRWYAEYRAQLDDPDAQDFGPLASQPESALVADATALPERDLLDRIGVPRPGDVLVGSAEAAAAAAAELRAPLAVKLGMETVLHKTEVGGVKLEITGPDAVSAAFAEIAAAVADRVVTDEPVKVLIQEMIPNGVELLIGISTDAQMGPILSIGFGGVLTEIVNDVARRPVPVSRADVRTMLDELRCAPLLHGFRGAPAADVEALVDLVLRLSWAAHSLREFSPEWELNPVIVVPEGEGAMAVDWLLRFGNSEGQLSGDRTGQ